MKNTYFGTTTEEEVTRIKDLWKKSLLVFIASGIFMVIAEGRLSSFLAGGALFFFVWDFRHIFLMREV